MLDKNLLGFFQNKVMGRAAVEECVRRGMLKSEGGEVYLRSLVGVSEGTLEAVRLEMGITVSRKRKRGEGGVAASQESALRASPKSQEERLQSIAKSREKQAEKDRKAFAARAAFLELAADARRDDPSEDEGSVLIPEPKGSKAEGGRGGGGRQDDEEVVVVVEDEEEEEREEAEGISEGDEEIIVCHDSEDGDE